MRWRPHCTISKICKGAQGEKQTRPFLFSLFSLSRVIHIYIIYYLYIATPFALKQFRLETRQESAHIHKKMYQERPTSLLFLGEELKAKGIRFGYGAASLLIFLFRFSAQKPSQTLLFNWSLETANLRKIGTSSLYIVHSDTLIVMWYISVYCSSFPFLCLLLR